MGTNYYAKIPNIPANAEGLHIGKKSMGWDFLFHAIPELGLTSVAAWTTFLNGEGIVIVNEYGVEWFASEFLPMALTRPGDPGSGNMRAHAKEDYFADRMYHVDDDARGVPFLNANFC